MPFGPTRRASRTVNQPPPAPRSATTLPSPIRERVHDLIGPLPRVAIRPFEQPEILRIEQPSVLWLAAPRPQACRPTSERRQCAV